VDGAELDEKADLMDTLQQHKVGDTVTLTYLRGGKEHDCKVTLEERK
jgi:putative serine protease PepD